MTFVWLLECIILCWLVLIFVPLRIESLVGFAYRECVAAESRQFEY